MLFRSRLHAGDIVESKDGKPIETATGDVCGPFSVVSGGVSDLAEWVDLERGGRVVAAGVSSDRFEVLL